jgi:asparagine synthetase B (glutamine-hydrolysing)
MAGVVAIIVALVLIPVMVLMSGGVASAIVGFFLSRDADQRHAGSELLELDD